MRRVSLLVSAWFLWGGPSVGAEDRWRGSSPSDRTTSGPSRGARRSATRSSWSTDQPGHPHRRLADQVRLHRRPGRRPGHPARHPDDDRGHRSTPPSSTGYKASGLTLVLDRPGFVEVDLNLTCFIRGDIDAQPRPGRFRDRPRARAARAHADLTYSGGQPNWGVTGCRPQPPRHGQAPRAVPFARRPGQLPPDGDARPLGTRSASSRTRSPCSPTTRPARRSPSRSRPTSSRP